MLGGFLVDTEPLRIELFGMLGRGLATLLTRLSAGIVTPPVPPSPPPQD